MLDFPEDLRCTPFPDPIDPITTVQNDCNTEATALAQANADNYFVSAVFDAAEAYLRLYRENCLKDVENRETFEVTYELDEYYYTLFYYDQAGNLIKTVPPEGVDLITDATDLGNIKFHRKTGGGNPTHPDHTFITNYRYNSFNQVYETTTPDGGVSHFWYDELGRVVASQNAEQAPDDPQVDPHLYSYMIYDALGRVIEAGEVEVSQAAALTIGEKRPYGVHQGWVNAGTRSQVTSTYYDAPLSNDINDYFAPEKQDRLRTRVATVTYEETYDGDPLTYGSASHYSYDIHGNVNILIQENTDLKALDQHLKRLDYDYDLVSGNVNAVHYQNGERDQFHHRYCYDADNRLTKVETSRDGRIWETEAKYFFFPHGPLARMEVGDKQVQASDYAYTMQGWLKGVNSNTVTASRDIGKDGCSGCALSGAEGLNENFAQDAMGFSLSFLVVITAPLVEMMTSWRPLTDPTPPHLLTFTTATSIKWSPLCSMTRSKPWLCMAMPTSMTN